MYIKDRKKIRKMMIISPIVALSLYSLNGNILERRKGISKMRLIKTIQYLFNEIPALISEESWSFG
jgi:hypothetical protein